MFANLYTRSTASNYEDVEYLEYQQQIIKLPYDNGCRMGKGYSMLKGCHINTPFESAEENYMNTSKISINEETIIADLLKSIDSVQNFFEKSSKASASGWGQSFKHANKFMSDQSIITNTVTFMNYIQYTGFDVQTEISSLKLSNAAKYFLKTEPESFFDVFGDFAIIGYVNGAEYIQSFQLQSEDEKILQEIGSSYELASSFKIGGFSASFETAYKKKLQSYAGRVQSSYKVYAKGSIKNFIQFDDLKKDYQAWRDNLDPYRITLLACEWYNIPDFFEFIIMNTNKTTQNLFIKQPISHQLMQNITAHYQQLEFLQQDVTSFLLNNQDLSQNLTNQLNNFLNVYIEYSIALSDELQSSDLRFFTSKNSWFPKNSQLMTSWKRAKDLIINNNLTLQFKSKIQQLFEVEKTLGLPSGCGNITSGFIKNGNNYNPPNLSYHYQGTCGSKKDGSRVYFCPACWQRKQTFPNNNQKRIDLTQEILLLKKNLEIQEINLFESLKIEINDLKAHV